MVRRDPRRPCGGRANARAETASRTHDLDLLERRGAITPIGTRRRRSPRP